MGCLRLVDRWRYKWSSGLRVVHGKKGVTSNDRIKRVRSSYFFGMLMPDRHDEINGNPYTYGFNGMERDEEVKGSGNSYDFGARMHDPRLGRWLSVDPHHFNYPGWSPYHYAACNPILITDPDGRDWYIPNAEGDNSDPVWFPNDADATSHFGEGAFINLGESLLDEVVVTPEGVSSGKGYNVPNYLINAKGEYGQTEIAGDEHNPRILEYHLTTTDGSTGQSCTTDEAAWCASFINWNVTESGLAGNDNQYSANAWSYRFNSNVQEIDRPAIGAVALINNSHVTFVVGVNGNNIHGYGGNQRDQVKVSTYVNPSSVRYFIPIGVTPNYDVPTIRHNFNTEQNESTR